MIWILMDSFRMIFKLLGDLVAFNWLIIQPHGAVAAENLFLRKQLAMYQERKLKPRCWPVTETPLHIILKMWVTHYNQGRPHSSIGPGNPDSPTDLSSTPQQHWQRIPGHLMVVTHAILAGLHYEYSQATKAT
jgi:hypothetical protein